jgi:glycosyltransferase involved in cell wall biosynthesis
MSNNKNILFISYDGMTDPLGQSQVIPYLAGLSKYGYRFTILSCEKPKRFALNKKNIETILDTFHIKWAPLLYHKKPPVISSMYDVLMLKRKARQLHAKENFDMVHTRAGLPALVGLWMKKKLAVKFLHDIREFYADSRVDGGLWNLNTLLYKTIYNYFIRMEEEQVKFCDGMVCLTYSGENIIRKWPQFNDQKILEVIPCCVDMDLFDPAKINKEQKKKIEKELNIGENDFIISYLGSIGGWYLTGEMMKMCKRISDRIPNAKFLFISPDEHDNISETAKRFGITAEKIIVRSAQRSDVPLLLSTSKYTIFFIKPCYSKKSSSPTKHGEIMAMGIPLITNSGVGDVADIVNKYHSGIVIENLNEESYASNSERMLTAHFDPLKIRSGAREFYALEKGVEKYQKVYDTILR